MRKIMVIFLCLIMIISCSACTATTPETGEIDESSYTKYQADFPKVFDTYTRFIAFTKTEKEFDKYSDIIYDKMLLLNNYYDIYNNYSGINNLKTINDNAGKKPVKVKQEIIDLLKLGKLAYEKTNGMVNITIGPVLKLWHDARVYSLANPDKAYLPDMEQLKEAMKNTNIEDLIIDENAKTVFLKNAGMSLDVGALAKGFAVKTAAIDAENAGLISGILNSGGNVVTIGKPLESTRQRWGVGITNPSKDDGSSTQVDTIYTNSISVVTSGNYQRFFVYDGNEYNHVINPETLMPADLYAGVTILHPDSGIAEMLSTALFILPRERGEPLLKEWNAEALWIEPDGTMSATAGYEAISSKFSGYTAVDK